MPAAAVILRALFGFTGRKAHVFLSKCLTALLNCNENFSGNENTLEFFQKIDYNVEGGFKVYNQNGKKVLRKNLDIANGPDVYLVLSNKKPSFGNKDYQIVDKLKANKGNFNVELKPDIDFSKYKYLLIHCKAFSHTFAGAEIAAVSP